MSKFENSNFNFGWRTPIKIRATKLKHQLYHHCERQKLGIKNTNTFDHFFHIDVWSSVSVIANPSITNISNGITQTSKLQLNKPNEHSILQAASRHTRMLLEHGGTSSLVWYKNPPLVQSKPIYGSVDGHSDRVNFKPAKKKRNF